MFRRILVPLDGSSLAERALPIAAHIARTLNGTIVLVRVVTTPMEMRSSLVSSLPSAAIQTMTEVHRMEANSYLRRIAASEELRSIPTENEVCVGQAAPAILSVANASNIDLLIMCRYGQRGRTRWMLGSVAEVAVG